MNNIVLLLYVLIIKLTFSFNSIAQEKVYQKPEKFPIETIELLKDKFQKEMILDTDTLLTADFTVYHKKSQEKELSFYGIEHTDLIHSYMDYLYAKQTVNDLAVIELEDDPELKRNYLFRLEIVLNNKPISIKDLEFAYNNWNIK